MGYATFDSTYLMANMVCVLKVNGQDIVMYSSSQRSKGSQV